MSHPLCTARSSAGQTRLPGLWGLVVGLALGVACRGSGSDPEADPPGAQEPPAPSGIPSGPDRPALPPGWHVVYHDAVDLALSADARWLAAGDLAGTALLFDLGDGHFVWGDKTRVGVTPHVAIAATGERFFAGQTGGDEPPLRALDVAARSRVATMGAVGGAVHDVACDREGRRVAVLVPSSGATPTVEDAIVVYELAPGRTAVGRELFTPTATVSAGHVALSPDGLWLAAISANGQLYLWKVGEATPALSWRSRGALRWLTFAVDSASFWVADEREVRHWDLAALTTTPEPTVATGAGDALHGLVALADGRVLGVGHSEAEGRGLSLYAGTNGAELGRAASGCRCERHAVGANGKTAVCLCEDATEIRWGPLSLPSAKP